jgi:hypothetical protein
MRFPNAWEPGFLGFLLRRMKNYDGVPGVLWLEDAEAAY